MIDEKNIAVKFCGTKKYMETVPFSPPELYPELIFQDTIDSSNEIYKAVREMLFEMGLDKDNWGTKNWNPFGEFIKPGMTVFLKPNTVTHMHPEKKDIFSVITHGAILRPVIDYTCKALQNSGRIIVGDSQLYTSDFQKAMKISKIEDLLTWYSDKTDIAFEWFDLRINKARRTYLYGKWAREKIEQDPRGYSFVDLGEKSCFKDIDPKKLRIVVASYKNMYKHHCNGKHQYLFPNSFLQSDVIINIPKLKTHRRTAVTLALKNFMGIPALKDSLPHFQVGSPKEGGDQYIHPSFRKTIMTFLHDQVQSSPFIPVKFVCASLKKVLFYSQKVIPFKDPVFEAMWFGNDTVWRTLHDLNRAVMYADKNGKISDSPQRTVFTLIDGIIGGENNGPVAPDPVYAGVLLAGFNQVAIDTVAATLMGFDYKKIPLINNGFKDEYFKPLFSGKPDDIQVIHDNKKKTIAMLKDMKIDFEPHPSWKGHVEL